MTNNVTSLAAETHHRTALVLGGGGARGAYEVGVLSYLREELEPEFGAPLPLEVMCGTSVGALNSCFIAATAEAPQTQAARLRAIWSSLDVDTFLRVDACEVATLAKQLVAPHSDHSKLGVVDVNGLKRLLGAVPWRGIGRNVRAGRLAALTLTATRVDSGQPTVFLQCAPGLERVSLPVDHVFTRIGPRHALASTAIPLVFPPVVIDGALYADGGLRMSVPLAPAIHCGADRVIVVAINPPSAVRGSSNEHAYSSAPFLVGKALTALLVDHTEQDVERLHQVNRLIAAGTRVYGPGFERELGQATKGAHFRQVKDLCVRPSQSFGALAAEYLRSSGFRRRRGVASRLLQMLAEREAVGEADLVSYLLFDGGYAETLCALGRADAAARHSAWLEFFADRPRRARHSVARR